MRQYLQPILAILLKSHLIRGLLPDVQLHQCKSIQLNMSIPIDSIKKPQRNNSSLRFSHQVLVLSYFMTARCKTN